MSNHMRYDWQSHLRASQKPTGLGIHNGGTKTGEVSKYLVPPETSLELGLTWNRDS